MSDLNLALQWHLCGTHVQKCSHKQSMFFEGLFLKVPTFIRLKHLDLIDDMISFLIYHIPLLCLLILSAQMYYCLHFS